MVFRRAIILLFCSGFGAVTALHATSLAWDPGYPNAGVLQYNIYERLPSGYVLVDTVGPSRTTYDLPSLSPGVHTFAVTAVSALMESRPSNEMTVSAFGSTQDFARSAPLKIMTATDLAKNKADYPSQLTIYGVTQPIANLRVVLRGVTHPVASELDILLVGPRGQKVMLMSDVGGKNPIVSADLVFSDRAEQALTTSPIVSGTYRPTNLNLNGTLDEFPYPAPARPYSKTLSVFNGMDANGNWQLFVMNDGYSGSGTIAGGWSLRLDSPGAPIVSASPTLGLTSTTATLNGMVNPMGQPGLWAFFFGLTNNYTDAQSPQSAGSGLTPVPATLPLTGLKPGTTYHYQLIAQNAFGASASEDMSFTTPALVDTDHDGMPDDYELLNQLNTASKADANRDIDGDGMSNLQEYLAGTNPRDSRSVLRITSVAKGWTAAVAFPTVPGKRYQLQRAANLSWAMWVVIGDQIQGTGQTVTLDDPWGADLPSAFYRAVVLP